MKLLFTITLLLVVNGPIYASSDNQLTAEKKPAISPEPDVYPGKAKPKQFVSRGQLLYQNHCIVCHESNVHIRNKKKAKSIAEINTWVSKWSTYRKLDWSESEINAVSTFLNNTYYKYTK